METLRKGSKGESVKTLQTALNRAGANLAIDGSFGAKTQEAVKAFQRANGLTVDGVVGPATWAKLDELSKPSNTQLYNAFVTCLDAIEALPEFKTLKELLYG